MPRAGTITASVVEKVYVEIKFSINPMSFESVQNLPQKYAILVETLQTPVGWANFEQQSREFSYMLSPPSKEIVGSDEVFVDISRHQSIEGGKEAHYLIVEWIGSSTPATRSLVF